MVIETRLCCTTCPCNLMSHLHHKASISQHLQHLNKENKKLRKLREISGRGIFRHDSKIMSQSLHFLLHIKRTHLQHQEPHIFVSSKNRAFLCWSSICPPAHPSGRHSSWQPVIDRLTKLGAKYRSFELCLPSMSFNVTAVYEEHRPLGSFVFGDVVGGNRMERQVCRNRGGEGQLLVFTG